MLEISRNDEGVIIGNNGLEIQLEPCEKLPVTVLHSVMKEPFSVGTLAGTMQGNAGDHLMVGVEGEMYPCSADIFAVTHVTENFARDQAEEQAPRRSQEVTNLLKDAFMLFNGLEVKPEVKAWRDRCMACLAGG